ncbi:MAG: response regulator [Archangium sp.]|nr:response regulator [Archangium sp.]
MKRVLVVDDDEAVRRLVAHVLQHSGYEVVLAEDGRQAMRLLDASFDILLCDKNLPFMPGTQVVLEARAQYPKLTTVLMTAAPEALALTTLGLDGYLAKPFRSNALLVHTLQAALDRRAQKEKRQELETQLQTAVAQLSRRDR